MTAVTKAKNEVARVEPTTIAPAQVESQSAQVYRSIMEAAKNDVAQMREMLGIWREIVAEEREQAFNDAMADAQKEMQPVVADAYNKHTESKYTSYAALDRAVRPIYAKHGFGLSFDTDDGAPELHVRVVCFVTARGHKRKYHIDLPADGKGAQGRDVMTRTHATVSATTYGQRALLKMIFNLAIDKDDDGNRASGGSETLTPEQLTALNAKIKKIGIDIEKVRAFAKVETLAEIYSKDFEKLLKALDHWAAKNAKATS